MPEPTGPVTPATPDPERSGRANAPTHDPATDAGARADLDAWRDAYVGRLAAPDGWWAISGLHWLEDGDARAGAADRADVPLPAPFPGHAATLHREGDLVTVTPATPGVLWTDGAPVDGPVGVRGADRVFALGPSQDAPRFAVLVRGERRGVRAYDPARAAGRDPDREVAWYPVVPGWVVPARFDPAAPGETVPIVNVQGDATETPAAGRLRFRFDGAEHALLATWAGERLFVNLRDAGSGPESYGAGRFLTVDPPTDGTTWLDFHRLHHPPCAHTPYATCPMPPLENRLPFAVRAGERSA